MSVPSLTDSALLCASQNGDIASLGLLLERYRGSLMRRATAWLGIGPQIEDAVQDTLVIAMTRIHQVRDPEKVGGWLAAILKNVCRMHLRSERIRQMRTDSFARRFSEAVYPRLSIEEIFERELRCRQVREAVETLPEGMQASVLLRYFSSYSTYEEIAVISGVPIGTVRSRLAAAKRHLLAVLKDAAQSAYPSSWAQNADRANVLHEMWTRIFRGDSGIVRSVFTDDLEFLFPQTGAVYQGRRYVEKEVHDDLKAGSRFVPTQIVVSAHTSLIEGRFENAPATPFRCPPYAMGLMFHHGERIYRLHFYLGGPQKASRDGQPVTSASGRSQ